MTVSISSGAIETSETSALQALIEADGREARIVLQVLRRRKNPAAKLRQLRAVTIPVDRVPAFVKLVDDAIRLARRLDLLPRGEGRR